MKKILKLSLLFLTITLFACGGGSSGGGSNAPAPQPTPPPLDLVVSSFTANPPTISSGQTVSLSATITNSGDLTADSITLRYHRSRNNSISDSGTPIATDDISNLSANSSSDATANVTGHSSGIMYYWACVGAVSGETSITNNCATTAIKITGPQPDISVSNFSASPTIISSDRKVNLSFTITNSGNFTANSITLRYHRSQSDNISDSGTPIATGDTSSLSAGGSNNVTASVNRHSSGTMYYWVCVGAVADESTTDNNCSNNAIAITIGVPDLVVDFKANSSTTTTDIDSGETFNLSAKIRNSGNFTANPTTLRFYRSQNNSTNNSDDNLATTDIISISRILANSSSDITASVTGHGSGIYYYWACVADVAGETNIANNCSDSVAVTAIVGASWQQSTASADWDDRFAHTSVVFKNKIWVLGGKGGSYRNDVWSSSNGTSWTEATDGSARWSARLDHTSIVFKNKIWVLGGYYGVTFTAYDDVWSSSNGINWTQATDDAGWSARSGHTSVVFDDKMWVLSGCCGKNDVWSSSNGSDWSRVTNNAGWSARVGHTSVVFDNKMWVLGGSNRDNDYNDVWFSSNGTSWTEVIDSADWTVRDTHTSTVFNNKIWVLGGSRNIRDQGVRNHYNDVWSSSNGIDWTQATASAGWSNRRNHTSIVFDNKIWVLGGSISGTVHENDVWSSGINNNSFTNATAINVGSKSLNSHSATLTAGASDYYKVYLETTGIWTFRTDGINTDCELYNSSQSSLFHDNNGGVCSIIQTITTAGDYYIKISGGNNSNSVTGNYTLKITAPQ